MKYTRNIVEGNTERLHDEAADNLHKVDGMENKSHSGNGNL